jgi:hypothetical protein
MLPEGRSVHRTSVQASAGAAVYTAGLGDAFNERPIRTTDSVGSSARDAETACLYKKYSTPFER